ncbi:hypothetical protein [Bradyrhizobium genosp. P]|uniref:hypothetical protein n=1 Tax=Bradyrhizobium genosp. P TaxID=83641 RepID=UPI003CE8A2C0
MPFKSGVYQSAPFEAAVSKRFIKRFLFLPPLICLSPDLRSAGSVLVLMSKYIRQSVAEMIMRVDAYNSMLEARGGEKVMLDSSARNELLTIKGLGD